MVGVAVEKGLAEAEARLVVALDDEGVDPQHLLHRLHLLQRQQAGGEGEVRAEVRARRGRGEGGGEGEVRGR